MPVTFASAFTGGKMKKTITAITLGIVACGLYGCLTSEKKSSAGNTTFTSTRAVISLDESARTIVDSTIEYDCYQGKLDSTIYIDSTRYLVSGGKLYEWPVGGSDPGCEAEVLEGSSKGIIGTWTTKTFSNAPIPVADRPESCSDTVFTDSSIIFKLLQNPSATMTVSSSTAHSAITGNQCYANFLARQGMFSSNGVVTKPGCDSVEVMRWTVDSAGVVTADTVVISSAVAGNAIEVTYQSKSATCKGFTLMDFTGKPDCSKPSLSDLHDCVYGVPIQASAKPGAGRHRGRVFGI